MNVNGTLIVQALNFFLAYIILRFLYFKPAAAALTKEQAVKDDLQVSIATLQATVAAKQYEQKKVARSYQVYYEQHAPEVAQSAVSFVKDVGAGLQVPTLDQKELGIITNEVVEQLLNKVDHV